MAFTAEEQKLLAKGMTVAPAETMYLRTAIGEGEVQGKPVEVSQNASGELLVRYAGRYAYIPLKEYTLAACVAIDLALKKKKRKKKTK